MEETNQEKKGPVIVLLDNSGSMKGEREIWSKAVTLAMAHVAKHQNRSFAIFHFNKKIARKDYFLDGKFDTKRLVESLAYFANGGTDFKCFAEAFKEIRENPSFHKADVIVLTDDAYRSDDLKDTLKKDKEDTGSNLYSIFIKTCHYGNENESLSALQEVSDKYVYLDDFEEDEGEATEMAFSI